MLSRQGPRAVFRYARASLVRVAGKQTPRLFVAIEDAADVDWTTPPEWLREPIRVAEGPVDVAWIMSPPGRESGGHQNLFRFIRYAEQAGHRCTIYLYEGSGASASIPALQTMLASTSAYAKVAAPIRHFDRETGVDPRTRAVFATGWETAYPAYLLESNAKRFYFVQDFEPSFYALGSESILAENTYRFGFHGITAGGWLADKLARDYGMVADHFDFAVDKSHYSVINTERRNEVFFYARPVTPRRGFELGVLALRDLALARPDVVINLAGWDVSNWDLPFEFRNHSSLDLEELNALYNRCAAGLVMSLSNMSLLPLELMSSGVAPVVNDGPNNRMVSDNPFIEYVPLSPRAIARRMQEVLERPDAVDRSLAMSRSVESVDWDESGRQFITAFERAMHG